MRHQGLQLCISSRSSPGLPGLREVKRLTMHSSRIAGAERGSGPLHRFVVTRLLWVLSTTDFGQRTHSHYDRDVLSAGCEAGDLASTAAFPSLLEYAHLRGRRTGNGPVSTSTFLPSHHFGPWPHSSPGIVVPTVPVLESFYQRTSWRIPLLLQ